MGRPASLKKPTAKALERGRELFRKHAWSEAVTELMAADGDFPLDPLDLVALAQACLLVGRDREGAEILARAHQGFLCLGDVQPAARCTFWLGFTAMLNGDGAQANGWLSRTERLLEGHPDCVEKGYLFLPAGYRLTHEGDAAKGYEAFVEAAAIGKQFADTDLQALARQGQGRALIRMGEIARGVALLDEAMISVTAGEVSPLTAGGVYCSVISACGEIFDLRRAQEWTEALDRWCADQPDLIPYRGQCLIHRAEILQFHGSWEDAFEQARQACEQLSRPAPRADTGAAYYRLAELYRLRGEFEAAENAYREAGRWQRTPQPGLAQLRFAQGQLDSACVTIRRIAEEVKEPGSRARVLDSYVEIMLGANQVAAAREAADELAGIARFFNAPMLQAMAARAEGAVLLAENDPKTAMMALRGSWATWCDLDAPYEAARTRVLMARACREIGDCDAAELELKLAREIFQKLGAAPDLYRLESATAEKTNRRDSSLTTREIEVLKLIASGKTNRAIALKLNISEKTVARHVSNIFNKLDLSSRAAATAFAYQNELV